MVRTLTVLTNETDGRTRGEALPRPLPVCDADAPGRRVAPTRFRLNPLL